MIVVVMGVSGVGKTTVGLRLARRLGWAFLDADDLHPQANVDKMATGVPLTDADRDPWLDAVVSRIDGWRGRRESAVVACSALRRRHRDRIAGEHDDVRFVYLTAPRDDVVRRLRARRGHYMPASLLDSQYSALEPPDGTEHDRVLTLDATASPDALVARAVAWLAAAARPED